MNAYVEYNPDVFRDKTILLPCDDPEWSNFTKYFAANPNEKSQEKHRPMNQTHGAKHPVKGA
jgi:hypothetical protein